MTFQDTTHTIATGAKRFFSGTMISRFTGLAREVAMAAVFGTVPAVAAFWMAFRFAHLLRRLFGEGALHVAFVPHFESLRKQDPALGARFFYDLTMGVSLLLLGITCLAEGVLGSVLFFSNLGDGNREVIRLTMLMLPALVFISLYALSNSLLNCEHSFFLPSVAPTALNLFWLLAIFLVWKKPVERAIEYLAMMIVMAFAFQWLVTLPEVLRYLTKQLGDKWKANIFSRKEMLRIARPFALGMLGVAATQINSALDTIFARAADPQGPAYLWYALRIQQLPLALFGVGLTGALLPPISRAIQKGETGQYLNFLNFAVKRSFLVMLPMMAALFVLGFPGINLIYGHGEFSQQATFYTTQCLWAYGVALLPMTLVLIFASAFYGHKNYTLPTILSLFSVTLNLGLNAVFVFIFHLGAISIALATALSACVNAACLAVSLKKEHGIHFSGVAFTAVKAFIASTLATLATLLCGSIFFHDNTLLWLAHKHLKLFPRELSTQLLSLGVQSLCFVLIFLITAYLLRIREIFDIFPRRKKA
jgi:putative peptidoglycan lipid II flippase